MSHHNLDPTPDPRASSIDQTLRSSSKSATHLQSVSDPPSSNFPVSKTVPTTPSEQILNHQHHYTPLTRIKSLSKLQIRSPIISQRSFLSPKDDNEDSNSVYSSKLLAAVPNTFLAIRNYYNDFTTIDWTKAFISTNRFNYELEHSRWIVDPVNELHPVDSHLSTSTSLPEVSQVIPLYLKAYFVLGKWALIIIIGFSFSLIAYFIDKIEILLVGFKHGYCTSNWFASQVSCCVTTAPEVMFMNVFKSGYVTKSSKTCGDWVSWSSVFEKYPLHSTLRYDFLIYVILTVILAHCACLITLSTKITATAVTPATPNDNTTNIPPPRVMYTSCGSGVPEVKTILSGFVIRRFLGTYALVAKTITLILAIASGMSLGKEGPYVHLATAVGNIAARFFPFIYNNEALKKQILCASASAGVALAFGSPLGGVLFILEEINHYLPSHQLFQIFFCAIISTLFLKFLNPYGTGKTVLFELKYTSDWNAIELLFFIGIGIAGGIFGACFIKFVMWWPRKFRELKFIKNHALFEVFCISLLTGMITFWNPYTKQASSELVLDLATPCTSSNELDSSLCPSTHKEFTKEIGSLVFAFGVKVLLTFVTFGLKLPCGIYVPSMVAGALYGRIVSMVLQWFNYTYNINNTTSVHAAGIMKYVCSSNSKECVDLGIYSMISAGAFMAGVTRMNITLVTILFELTSSYTYVLPISVSIAVANWAGGLLEKNSLYESLLISNDYPFMSSENEAINPFVTAGDIINDMEAFDREDTDSLADEPGHITVSRLAPIEYLPIDNDKNKLFIDVTDSPYVSASFLQSKLYLLAGKGLLDGCLPLIKRNVCVGVLFFSELEFCLDKLKEFCAEYDIHDEFYFKLLNRDKLYNNSGGKTIKSHQRHNANIITNSLGTRNEVDYFNYGSIENRETFEMIEMVNDLTNLTKHVDCSPIFLNYDSELSLAHLIFDKIGNTVIVLLKDGKYYGVLHKKVLIDYCRREHS